jgi:hypothetical protein
VVARRYIETQSETHDQQTKISLLSIGAIGLEKTEKSDSGDASFRALFVFVAVVAYTITPVLKYSDTLLTVLAAGTGGIGVQLMMVGRKTGMGLIGCVLMIGGLVWGADLIFDATQAEIANQKRCLPIEADMLSEKPKRNDNADVFQALGCVPQILTNNVSGVAKTSNTPRRIVTR